MENEVKEEEIKVDDPYFSRLKKIVDKFARENVPEDGGETDIPIDGINKTLVIKKIKE